MVKLMSKLRIIELFAGIGAFSKALKNQEIDYEILDAVEIDKYAIKSYNIIHNTNFEPQDIIKWNKDFQDVDIIMHGSPCQDFSNAGLGKGGVENSKTQSSLLWETVKICDRIKPNIVIWENVKGVLSKKHRPQLDKYLSKMSELGYYSTTLLLNSKNFGIPQNRERIFVISQKLADDQQTVADQIYKFEYNVFNLKNFKKDMIPLKSFLEHDELDNWYFLKNKETNFRGREINTSGIANTITASQDHFTKRVNANKILVGHETKNYIVMDDGRCVDSAYSRVFKPNMFVNTIISTIPTKILVDTGETFKMSDGTTRPLFKESENGIITLPLGKNFTANKVATGNNIIPTIQASQTPKILDHINFINWPRNTDNKLINGAYNRAWKRNKFVGTIASSNIPKILEKKIRIGWSNYTSKDNAITPASETIGTICAHVRINTGGDKILVPIANNNNYLIVEWNKEYWNVRVLTELECWLLMGFNEIDFNKAKQVNNRAQLYKQAGNSIVVPILEEIIKILHL